MSVSSLDDDDLQRILGYLELPPSSTLPSLPLTFLTQHVSNLLPSHLVPFSRITTPRQRASIPIIKARRVLYASATPPKPELTADQARLRWPLLWERMGGDSRLPPPSANVEEEEKWVEENFLPGKANSQHVKKLGGFLRILEEEREIENVIAAKRAERRFDNAGEEFEEESDEEEENDALFGRVDGHGNGPVYPIMVSEVEQAEVRRAFEKRVLEMFVDGIDVGQRKSRLEMTDKSSSLWIMTKWIIPNHQEAIPLPFRTEKMRILTIKSRVELLMGMTKGMDWCTDRLRDMGRVCRMVRENMIIRPRSYLVSH